MILNCLNFQYTSCEMDATEAPTCQRTWTKREETERVDIHFPHVDHTRWHRGPSLCFWDPGLVIEQYALLCATRAHPPVLCMCFISPFIKEEALQTATFTLLLAAPLNELEHLSICYTTHGHRGKKTGRLLSFPLTVMRKNIKRAWSTMHWALGVKE